MAGGLVAGGVAESDNAFVDDEAPVMGKREKQARGRKEAHLSGPKTLDRPASANRRCPPPLRHVTNASLHSVALQVRDVSAADNFDGGALVPPQRRVLKGPIPVKGYTKRRTKKKKVVNEKKKTGTKKQVPP